MITAQKRKEMENLIYSTFSAIDPTESNTEKYKKMFKSMSNAEFDKFFKNLFENEDLYLIMDTVDYEIDLQMSNIEKAAKVLDIPLFERVIMPFKNKSLTEPSVTKCEVPVGYIHIKRMQQILVKKNSTSTDISSRSPLTGQVVNRDKNARDSDQENFALVTLDAVDTLREFMGPRSDDFVMKGEMYSQIATNGYVSLDSLTNKVENKTTLNTIDVFLIGMGLKSDLITDGLVFKKTLNE